MSGTVPKASNRQIRRAFGPDVIKTIDRHADMLESVRTYLQLVEKRLQALEHELSVINPTLGRHIQSEIDYDALPLWRKVRRMLGW